jgi:protein gp37
MAERYSGPPRIVEKELRVNYGLPWRPEDSFNWRTDKAIFVENCSDLFAEGVLGGWISEVLYHCNKYPQNTYVFQTKNPARVRTYLIEFPPRYLIGTTAESNRMYSGNAPRPSARLRDLEKIGCDPSKKFITIEPILKFDFSFFYDFLLATGVKKIYVGADSKGHGLPEPTGGRFGR